jgi:hypothetical protein
MDFEPGFDAYTEKPGTRKSGWVMKPTQMSTGKQKAEAYGRKPKYRAGQETRFSQATEEERKAQQRAEAEKRQERRAKPIG